MPNKLTVIDSRLHNGEEIRLVSTDSPTPLVFCTRCMFLKADRTKNYLKECENHNYMLRLNCGLQSMWVPESYVTKIKAQVEKDTL